MTFLVTILRFVIVLLVVRIGLRFLAGVAAGLKEPPRAAPAGVDMVRDRVCNTFVPRERAVTALVSGHEMHFCSTSCRDRALALSSGP
jgi:hypothetical protein